MVTGEELIAVLAGTPVDTRMGVDCLTAAGLGGLAFPLASDPRRQTAFQISSREEKEAAVLGVLRQAMAQGCRKAFVYCNSLSSSVDFGPLAAATGLHIVTPLDVYRALAPVTGGWGSSPPTPRGWRALRRTRFPPIRRWTCWERPCCRRWSPLRRGCRRRSWWSAIILPELAEWFRRCGMEALVLGCTHFPYFKEALAARTSLPLIDRRRKWCGN